MSDPSHDDDGRRFAAAVFRAQLAQAFQRPVKATWVLLALLVAIGLAQETVGSWLGAMGLERVLLAAALIPERVLDGDWWRPWTGTLVHKDWPHLLLNAVGLALIGRYVEVAYGASGFVVLWLLATLTGASGTVLAGHAISVGASGGVFGLVGAFVTIGLRLWPRLPPGLRFSLALLPALVLVAILGLGELAEEMEVGRVDRAAHLGGTLGGLLGGALLPLRLHEAGGQPLVAATPAPVLRAVQALALLAIAGWALAVVAFALHADRPPPIEPPALRRVDTGAGALALPVARRGVWRNDACEGNFVDADWAIAHGHTLCVDLAMGSVLLVGRRDRLLTLDAGDYAAMARAFRERRFVRRQAGVLLHPVGRDHVYVVLAAEALLQPLTVALAAMLPMDATITEAK